MDGINQSLFYLQEHYADNIQKKANRLEKNLANDDQNEANELYQACEDFEAIFYQLIFKEMRKTVQKSGLTDGGYAEELFESMLDEEIAKSAAINDGSLANLLYQQLRFQLDN